LNIDSNILKYKNNENIAEMFAAKSSKFTDVDKIRENLDFIAKFQKSENLKIKKTNEHKVFNFIKLKTIPEIDNVLEAVNLFSELNKIVLSNAVGTNLNTKKIK
ncbi:hypothetical protein V4B71_28080, partial [Klebsiella pneumoniae]